MRSTLIMAGLLMGVSVACTKKEEVIAPTRADALSSNAQTSLGKTGDNETKWYQFMDEVIWNGSAYIRITGCPMDNGNCLLGAVVVGDKKPIFEQFQIATATTQGTLDFFNGNDWQELWPELEGTDYLHMLQNEPVQFHAREKNESGQLIFVAADPSLSSEDVSDLTAYFALMVKG